MRIRLTIIIAFGIYYYYYIQVEVHSTSRLYYVILYCSDFFLLRCSIQWISSPLKCEFESKLYTYIHSITIMYALYSHDNIISLNKSNPSNHILRKQTFCWNNRQVCLQFHNIYILYFYSNWFANIYLCTRYTYYTYRLTIRICYEIIYLFFKYVNTRFLSLPQNADETIFPYNVRRTKILQNCVLIVLIDRYSVKSWSACVKLSHSTI